jgi:hypothetical protein
VSRNSDLAENTGENRKVLALVAVLVDGTSGLDARGLREIEAIGVLGLTAREYALTLT